MSFTIDTVNKFHDRQIATVSTLQFLLVKAVESLSEITDKAPKAPEKLSRTLDEVAAPLTKIVGTPSEVQAYAVASSRDWLESQQRFQTALLHAATPSAVTAEVPKKATTKKN